MTAACTLDSMPRRHSPMSFARRGPASPACALLLALRLVPVASHATLQKSKSGAGTDAKSEAKSEVTPAPKLSHAPGAGADNAAAAMGSIAGLPRYEAPPEYSVDLVIHSTEAKDMV